MTTPHRDLSKVMETHRKVRDRNPLFYVKTASWYLENGTVRDHKVAFILSLFESKEPKLRDAGWALLQKLPPELVFRVALSADKVSRSLRSAVIHYLAEMPEGQLKYHVLRGARQLKKVIRRLHIPTLKSENRNLQFIGKELFTKTPEVRAIFKKLQQAENSKEVAELLMKTRLPAHIAVSAIKVRTPEIMRELIKSMSPSELLQSLNSLGRMKVLEPNLKLIISKIEKALQDKRISAARIHQIKKHLDPHLVPSRIFQLLDEISTAKIEKMSRIKGKVAIHVDTSGSMEVGIEVAKKLATILSTACETPPLVYTVCETPMEIRPAKYTAEGWDEAFSLIRVGGSTPLGAGIKLMKMKGETCDVLLLITDEGENAPPFFLDEYLSWEIKPHIIIVRVGAETRVLSSQLSKEGVPYDLLSVREADQYSLDQIVRLIGKASPFETVMEIMELPIPERPTETKTPNYWRK